jgi:hypothetical protein
MSPRCPRRLLGAKQQRERRIRVRVFMWTERRAPSATRPLLLDRVVQVWRVQGETAGFPESDRVLLAPIGYSIFKKTTRSILSPLT